MTKLTPLKLARLHTGKSQWHVAKETGIPQTVVSLYERELKEPKPEHKEALTEHFSTREVVAATLVLLVYSGCLVEAFAKKYDN